MGSRFSASMCEPDPRRRSRIVTDNVCHSVTGSLDGLDRWIGGRGEEERWRPSIPGPDGGDSDGHAETPSLCGVFGVGVLLRLAPCREGTRNSAISACGGISSDQRISVSASGSMQRTLPVLAKFSSPAQILQSSPVQSSPVQSALPVGMHIQPARFEEPRSRKRRRGSPQIFTFRFGDCLMPDVADARTHLAGHPPTQLHARARADKAAGHAPCSLPTHH